MYWSEVFSHSKVAPFDLSKGSPSGEFKNYGKPTSYGKSTTFTSCPVLWGKQRAVMSTIRCTRSPKREGEKKSQAGRATEASLTLCCPRCPSTAVGKPDPGSFATGPPAASISAGISASQPWLSALTPYSNVAFTMVKNKSSVCCINLQYSPMILC